MKYIRTKDSIYKLEMAKEFGIEDLAIKQADTIEELCDEFVGVDVETKTGCINQYNELDKVKEEMKHYDFQIGKDYEIYGAIWTDKGLIYVAKMNEKGESELL